MFNNCRCNHPCPIFCYRLRSCTNDIVNPIITRDFGYFNNTATQTIASSAIIPVYFVLGEGTSVVPSLSTSGAVTLAQGTYEISYFANVTIPEGGSAEIALRLNGAVVSGSSVIATGTAGQVVPVSQTVMLSVAQSSTLELVNVSANSIVTNLASMSIKKL